jgi:FeS assembly SUF system protein
MNSNDLAKLDGELFNDEIDVEHYAAYGTEDFHHSVILSLRSIHDPEIPLNIYDLGLIYKVFTLGDGVVKVEMTLTSPSCPEAESIPGKIRFEIEAIPDTKSLEIDIVWDPPWGPDRMSEAARLELGFF